MMDVDSVVEPRPEESGESNGSEGSSQQAEIEPEIFEHTAELSRTISALQSSLHRKSTRLPRSPTLVFATQPQSLDDPPGDLLWTHPDNAEILATHEWIQGNIQFLDLQEYPEDPDLLGRVVYLKRKLAELEKRIQNLMSVAWEREKVNVGLYGIQNEAFVHSTARWFKARESRQPFVLAALLLAIILHGLADVSRPTATFVLATIKAVLFGAFLYDSTPERTSPTPAQLNLLDGIPLDVRTILKNLDLEPNYILYACCSRCFKLYPPNISSPNNPYPHLCTHRPTPDDPECGGELVRKIKRDKQDAWVAIKTFALQSFRSWLGQLLSRPGIEKMLERSWKPSERGRSGTWTDIMDAPGIQGFLGPDGHTLFSQQPKGSSHLVFSLFVDWFNPFGNKKAGKSHSVGAIYMVCLNLPPDQRYRTENIFLAGIMPGPNEPSLKQINHFLGPLVDELLTLWHSGIFLNRTATRFSGRLVRAAVIPLVCDLPALRKVAGFAAHGSKKHFCSFCGLHKDNIRNLDRNTWYRRTWKEHMDIALRWRDAGSSKERNDIFDEHGIRWSELLRLPYWDPTRYALVDAMHNLYLGDLRRHCREVLGVDVKDTESNQRPHLPEEQASWLQKVKAGIERGSASALQGIRKGYIAAVADRNAVVPSGTNFAKKAYIEALLEWYKTLEGTIELPPVLEEATTDFHSDSTPKDLSKLHLLDANILQEIRADMKKTFLPSWVPPAPSNFGNASHGKLKAAQWRTVCTINMVITLVRLWAHGGPRSTKRNRQLLNNFIDLVLAVEFATRRSMSRSRAASYDAHMLRYLQDLLEVFDHKLVPNHHMSLHLRECMELFGPVHAWWAFPFERYNGIIGQLKTNNKTSDMPLTFLRYFCIGSNLRWLMASVQWPNVRYFKDMVAAYGTAFGRTLDGLWTGSSGELDTPFVYDQNAEQSLDRETYDALIAKANGGSSVYISCFTQVPGAYGAVIHDQAQFVNKVTVLRTGQAFAPAGRGQRNSYILYKTPSDLAESPAQIEKIFYHRRYDPSANKLVIEPFFLVKPFIPRSNSDAEKDPFRAFDGLNTALFYSRTAASPILLRQSDIVSHFAAYTYVPEGIDQECIVVRSLDRE